MARGTIKTAYDQSRGYVIDVNTNVQSFIRSYIIAQFNPWFKLNFVSLLNSLLSIILSKKQRKVKFEPRTKLTKFESSSGILLRDVKK